MPLISYCYRDLTTIKICKGGGAGRGDLILASAYLPYEARNPVCPALELLAPLVEEGGEIVVGCDANAHHEVWGSSDINRRGEELLDFLVSSPLLIVNTGNSPTFVNRARQEVIDITIASKQAFDKVRTWKVSNETSLSDHRYICFEYVLDHSIDYICRRNPRHTAWLNYKQDLKQMLGDPKGNLNSVVDIEFEADRISSEILTAWTNNCPAKMIKGGKTPWWTSDLERRRKDTRREFNRAKVTKNFGTYRMKLTEYNKAVRKAKRAAWVTHCQNIESIPEGMRLVKALASTKANPLASIKDEEGRLTTTGKDTLDIMYRRHFPGSLVQQEDDLVSISADEQLRRTVKADWHIAKRVVDQDRVKWALNSFKPYKAPGPDGIYPILLQQGESIINPHICRIFKACIAFGHIPTTWRRVKIIFIPKPGKADYQEAGSYRPISLTSFLLKTLEKLVDRHIREGPLRRNPLHRLQCAYQSGKSTETALHHVTKKAEFALDNKEICLAAFLDIEGAFDRTTFESINVAACGHGISRTICKWMTSMLKGRIIESELLGDNIKATCTKGCPQGGVLSPLMWSLVVDSLLTQLNEGPLTTVGYADDLVIMVNGRFPGTVTSTLNLGLRKVERWCNLNHLSINTNKAYVVAFTKQRKLEAIRDLTLYGNTLPVVKEVKYLGVTLDRSLTWNSHLKLTISKALRVFCMVRSAYGKTWGLNPKVMKWLYTMMVRPIITYGAIVWWPRVKQSGCHRALSKFQRTICMAMTGAFRSAPSAALERITGISPLDLAVEMEARKAIYRLRKGGIEVSNQPITRHMKLDKDDCADRLMDMIPEDGSPTHVFQRRFKVITPTREDWNRGIEFLEPNSSVWYTDGSKMGHRAGAGVYSKEYSESFSMGALTTVFQAETQAIILCAHEMINRKLTGMNVYILSDSQAALSALMAYKVTSSLVLNGIQILNKLGGQNRVSLIWVPGHRGIEGNERADELARRGSSHPFTGPEPCVGVSKSEIDMAIGEHFRWKAEARWRAQDGLRHSKEFMEGYNPSKSNKVMDMKRTDVRILSGVYTGHWGLQELLYKMKLSDSSECRHCKERAETMKHILCDCDALARRRMDLLGLGYPEPSDYRTLSLTSILRFAREALVDRVGMSE